MKKWIYRKKSSSNPLSNKFVHYWSNDGENFPDFTKVTVDGKDYVDIEHSYLIPNYGNDYEWVEVPDMRIEKNTLDRLKIELSIPELYENKTIFIKLVDETGKEIDQYFYAAAINQVSDENYSTLSFSVTCELDYWATFGGKMHYWMKQDDCTEKFLFFRKMCNRFFKLEGKDNYWLDYLLQPWLMQTGKYAYALVRDKDEEFLKYDNWLEMNGVISTTRSQWEDNKYPSASINTWNKSSSPSETVSYTGDWIQNGRIITDTSFKDSDYNSNGKYRYMALKVGNNWPKDSTEARTNGCINTKEVVCNKQTVSINGETLLMIPFKKYEEENNYLKYLNLPSTGLIVANGSLLGTCINDIPPTILAAAIRNYSRVGKQPLGDKLSLHEANSKTCPFSITNLELYPQEQVATEFKFKDMDPKPENPVISVSIMDEEGKETLGAVGVINPKYDWSTANNQYFSFKIPHDESEGKIYKGLLLTVPDESIKEITTVIVKESSFLKAYNKFVVITNEDTVTTNNTLYFKYHIADPTKPGIYEKNNFIGWTYKDIVSADSLPVTNSVAGYSWIYKTGENINTQLHEINANRYFIPSIIHDFSYIPVTIEKSDKGEIKGKSRFFSEYTNLLKEGEKLNIEKNEPLIYSPAFWQWIYYIDGLHKIILTGDMLDFNTLINEDWYLNIDITMTSSTNIRLDLNKNGENISLKNVWYPFTKSTTELISYDPITFPSTTEAFSNWIQNNAWTQETSKNAKDIDIKWARNNYFWNIPGNILGQSATGVAGGSLFSPMGAVIGGIAGLITGGLQSGIEYLGLHNRIQEVNEKWENEWRGTLGNMYSAPTSLNPSGFATGSLIYSSIADADQNHYSLFKTFTITPQAKREIWNDICMNGYYYKSQCKYKDYDNRKKFNIMNCNFDNKTFYVDTYLRDKMMNDTMIFSQQNWIDWFKAKCKGMMRIFKVDFKSDTFETIIKENIENSYVIPEDLDK